VPVNVAVRGRPITDRAGESRRLEDGCNVDVNEVQRLADYLYPGYADGAKMARFTSRDRPVGEPFRMYNFLRDLLEWQVADWCHAYARVVYCGAAGKERQWCIERVAALRCYIGQVSG